MHKKADGNQKYLNSLFNLATFCVHKIKAQSKVNLNKFILFHAKVNKFFINRFSKIFLDFNRMNNLKPLKICFNH